MRGCVASVLFSTRRRVLIHGMNHTRNKFFLSLQGVSFFFTKMKEMPFKNKITNSEKK